MIIGVLALSLTYFAYDKFVLSASREAAMVEAAVDEAVVQVESTIVVNDDGALLKGEIKFLELLNPTVEIKWDVSTLLHYLLTNLLELVSYPSLHYLSG